VARDLKAPHSPTKGAGEKVLGCGLPTFFLAVLLLDDSQLVVSGGVERIRRRSAGPPVPNGETFSQSLPKKREKKKREGKGCDLGEVLKSGGKRALWGYQERVRCAEKQKEGGKRPRCVILALGTTNTFAS